MDDRELTVEQKMFLVLRKERGLTLSRTKGRGFDGYFFEHLSRQNS